MTNSVPHAYILRYETANSTALGGHPKRSTICRANTKLTAPITTPISTSSENAVLKISPASALFPSPILIPARGAPPRPMRFANAWIISVIGSTMPSAARASIPESSICATYMRSTILYRNVISCAITAGIESRTISGSIRPFPSSSVIFFFSFVMLMPPLYVNQKIFDNKL